MIHPGNDTYKIRRKGHAVPPLSSMFTSRDRHVLHTRRFKFYSTLWHSCELSLSVKSLRSATYHRDSLEAQAGCILLESLTFSCQFKSLRQTVPLNFPWIVRFDRPSSGHPSVFFSRPRMG